MKKILSIVLASALAAGLAGCGTTETAVEAEAEQEAEVLEETVEEAEDEVVNAAETAADSDTDDRGRKYVDEFDPLTNQVIDFFELEFQIPEGWTEEDISDNSMLYNSDSYGGALSIAAGTSVVQYDMNSAETQDDLIDALDSGDAFFETGRETMTVLGDITALYVSCTQIISGVPLDIYVLIFSTEEYLYIFSYQDDQDSEYNHSREFDEIISTMTWAPE